jgi:hypothetical protein
VTVPYESRTEVGAHVAVPIDDVLVLEVFVDIVDLVEELPGQHIGKRAPAGDHVTEPLLV